MKNALACWYPLSESSSGIDFVQTALTDLCVLLSNIHSVFERSPQRLRALIDLAEVRGD